MIVLRNILAVIVGLVVGGSVNMGLILLGPSLVPPPPGVDPSNAQSLAANIHLFEARHFLFPFLAHALGTLAGALAAYLVAGSRRAVFAWAIGLLTLAGGVAAAFMIPAPAWFIAADLLLAYVPMTLLAIAIGRRLAGGAARPA
ncbi:MAG: hypothetical protein AB7O32_14235 [Vicinamibacterales bacterium]